MFIFTLIRPAATFSPRREKESIRVPWR